MHHVFDEVLLFCPEVKTGGPEALHQLAGQIVRHGGQAHMVYYGPVSHIAIDGDVLRCHAEASPMPAHFAQYRAPVLREARLTPATLIVFPEPLSKMAAALGTAYRRALWWLSLNNVLAQNPDLLDESYRKAFFADPDLLHFHQSDYARRFLEAHQARQYYPLSDYTDPDFVHHSCIAAANPPIELRDNVVCYFPNKGAELAARFIEGQAALRSRAAFVPIREMSKAEVRETLFRARVYIDFGHHPGKDRVPREAAIAGAVVLLQATGAAACFADHPLPAAYLFTEEDLASGGLHRRLDAILADPAAHFAAQRHYRQVILLERERFDLEVRAIFFDGA
jgi:hypothetical protein